MILPLSVEKPHLLPLILLVIPAVIFISARYKKITRAFGSSCGPEKLSPLLKPLRFSLASRTALRCLAWAFAVLALSEISFGTKRIPVHKSGSNVAFVFDISYSMLATDAPQKATRLDAVKMYASSLLERLSSSSFLAVLAKGDGFTAIPETEDAALMENLIQNLSPALMTSAGSSLAKGLDAALNAIPPRSAKSQYIWIFTDGDETDSRLEKSLETAARLGIPVTLVGFGSEDETEITAGDGKTRVRTALRSQKMRALAENANKHNYSRVRTAHDAGITYVDSREAGSAWKLLNQVRQGFSGDDDLALVYETQAVNHHALFISLSLLCLVLSFVLAEFNLSSVRKIKNLLAAAAILASVPALSSCSSEKKQILDGVWAWHEGKYTAATADFLSAAQKTPPGSTAHEYAVFDLSATYLSMNETESSLERLRQLNLDSENLPAGLRSASFYNMGIIHVQKNDYAAAAECFKKALLANPQNMSAKINLELCGRELMRKQAESAEAEMHGAAEEQADNSDMRSELFKVIRESEGKKWRNIRQPGGEDSGIIDY